MAHAAPACCARGRRFPVYDALNFAPARFFLPARTPESVEAANATGLLMPAGTPGRQNLAEDLRAMSALGEMYVTVGQMGTLITVYTFLQVSHLALSLALCMGMWRVHVSGLQRVVVWLRVRHARVGVA